MKAPSPAYRVGLDLGSVSLDCVALDGAGRVAFAHYARTGGRPRQAVADALRAMVAALGDAVATGVVVTGSGKELIAGPAGLETVNEIVAQATAAWTKHPDVRSIIEIGGQDSKYIVVGRTSVGTPFLQDHAFNELCAAGTGAFLDQQAERLKLSIEAFGALAHDAARAARMAGRCSVFAKSDMIHLQQAAVPVDEIAAGLCRALARTYLAALCRGRAPSAPVLFQGGVARNPGVVRAFRELLGLGADGLIVPDGCELMGAFGAAVIAGERPLNTPIGLTRLLATFAEREAPAPAAADLKPLARRPTAAPTAAADPPARPPFVLGIDVGSVSTKGVIVDSGHARLRSSYRPTAGDPQEAIRQVIRELWAGLPADCRVAHVVATGSGRHLARALLGGGTVDEISAQAASAAFFFPQVDTVFEIGGQDAKFLRVKGGRVETFRMNRACAAGTGAFLEEQAARLEVRIAGEFSEAAFRSGAPAALGSRCTVFMDSDLVHHLQNDAHRDDLCAGLAYAVAQNYLEKVVGPAPVGCSVVFQGGVARNPAVHAGFEALLGRDILLHPCPELSGAMGAAMVALEELRQGRPTDAFSPERLRSAGPSETFECRRCENRCGITKIAAADQAPVHFGSVCGRFETADLEPPAVQDAFAARERLLCACLEDAPGPAPRGTIGLPVTLSLSDHLPFWATFFRSLGYAVRPSRRTCRPIVEAGLRHVPAEFCYPIKLLFGHVHDLLDRGQRRIFIPHLRMLTPPGERAPRYACPYTQAAPYVVRENVPADAEIVTLEYPVDGESAGWAAAAADRLGVERDEVAAAWAAARTAMGRFQAACREEGRRLLEELAGAGRRGAVLIGRPYNTTDRHANLDLARRLRQLGIEPVPFDFLPLGSEPLPALWERIRWSYGRKLVQAARVLKRHPNLGAVIVTNFGCGPDAFVDQYLEVELKEVPHLVIELDDHQAEAGLVTRLEAFARNFQLRSAPASAVTGIDPGEPRRPLREYTYYVPAFMDHAYAITGALKASGCRTVLLPPTDDHSWSLGLKHAYGRECHPFIAFTGDLLRAAERPDFRPAEACYFGPSYFGPCLLPQYPLALHLILERLGLSDVTVMNITDYSNMRELGPAYMLRLALGLYAIDRLYKWKTEIQPREARAGEVEAVYREILVDLERGVAERRFFRALRRSIARLGRIPLSGEGSGRPRVGIVGDVYTRVNVHSNDGLYRRLNRMGVDVWTSASVIDVSLLALEQWPAELSRKGRRLPALLAAGMQPALRLARWRVDRCFPAGIRTPQERRYSDVRRSSSRYVSFWIDKVLSLNLNRIEELHAAGADGVLNVMCHNCMLGTITASLSHSIRRNTGDTPLCTLVFEGLKSTHTRTRLEAFVHQLHSRRGCRGRADG